MIKYIAMVICTLSITLYAASMRTGTMLLRECEGNADPIKSLKGGCEYYVKGVVFAEKLKRDKSLKCMPKEITLKQQEDIVVAYLKSHPNQLKVKAPKLIESALKEKFPCTK